MSWKRRPVLTVAIVMLLTAALLMTALLPPSASAAGTSLTPADKSALAARFAPTLRFHPGEEVFPVEVEYFISNSNLNESVSETAVLISPTPTAVSLGDYNNPSRNFYLDNRLGTINDHRIIDAYKSVESALGYTVYAHVTSNLTHVVVQYWFFYVFNQGTYNTHEGDWEMIEVILDASWNPISAAYSQHEQGQRASWSQVEKSGDSPITYIAKGSHANYFRSYQGKMGPAQDEVAAGGKVLKPNDYTMVLLGEKGAGNHAADQNWIDFSGRWGDWGNQTSDFMGQRGPLGPAYRMGGQMWTGLSWADSRAALDDNQLLLELLLSYLPLILVLLLLIPVGLMVRRVIRKRRAGEALAPYSYLLDFRTSRLRAAANVVAIVALLIGLVAAFLPFYEASVNVPTGQYATDGFERVLYVDGVSGIQVDTLDLGGGVVQLGALPFPFWVLIAVSLLAFIISTVARGSKKAGRKLISRGIGMFMPLILALIVVSVIGSMANTIAGPGGDDSTQQIIKTIASNPMGGEQVIATPDFGSVTVRWGVGVGAYILVFAGVLMIVAGALYITSKKEEAKAFTPEGQPMTTYISPSAQHPLTGDRGSTPPSPEPAPVHQPGEGATQSLEAGREEGKITP